jgi:maltoporin
MKTRTILRSAPLIVGALLAIPASAQIALESNGYFRAGPGATSKNANRACYGLSGADFKYRLGNECDFYGEFLFSGTVSRKDAPEVYKVHFMPSIFKGNASDSGDAKYETAQMWGEVAGLDFAPEMSFWGGKRYHRGSDIHIVDTFFEKLDGTGAGATLPMLGGKLDVAYYRADSSSKDASGHDNPGSRYNVWLRDVPVNQGGKINVVGTITKGTFDGGKSGASVSVRHSQAGVFGGDNNLWLQVSQGSAGLAGNFGTLTDGSDVKKWRLVDGYQFQFTENLGGQAIAMYESKKSDAGDATVTSLGGRLSYAFTRNFKLLGEVGIDRVAPKGGDAARLTKFTIAPTLAGGKGFWDRPELRLYVTRANWNGAANTAAGASGLTGLGDGKTSGTSYGVQAEFWW